MRERGTFTIEQAVHNLTQRPAEIFGITDRGVLADGRPADVVVFDPKTVGPGPLKRVYDLPAGADRLVSEAHGIDAVIVNGQTHPARRQGRRRRQRHAARPRAAQRPRRLSLPLAASPV